jgi:hypothetical protein
MRFKFLSDKRANSFDVTIDMKELTDKAQLYGINNLEALSKRMETLIRLERQKQLHSGLFDTKESAAIATKIKYVRDHMMGDYKSAELIESSFDRQRGRNMM